MFPNATVVLHEKEFAYADAIESHDSDTPAYMGRALRRQILKPISGESELCSGVRIVELLGHTPGSIGLLIGNELLAGDTVSCAGDAAAQEARYMPATNPTAHENLQKALASTSVISPGHDQPSRVRRPITYLGDYTIRIRFFTDPTGPDEEIRVGSFAAKSFASRPTG